MYQNDIILNQILPSIKVYQEFHERLAEDCCAVSLLVYTRHATSYARLAAETRDRDQQRYHTTQK